MSEPEQVRHVRLEKPHCKDLKLRSSLQLEVDRIRRSSAPARSTKRFGLSWLSAEVVDRILSVAVDANIERTASGDKMHSFSLLVGVVFGNKYEQYLSTYSSLGIYLL